MDGYEKVTLDIGSLCGMIPHRTKGMKVSDPLKDFLEDIEVLVRQTADDDAELGRRVRAAWVRLLDREKTDG